MTRKFAAKCALSFVSPVVLTLALSLQAFAASKYVAADCQHFLLHETRKVLTWSSVTDRKATIIQETLDLTADQSISTGRKGPLPAYDVTAILNGDKNVLSLGEGLSNYVSSILARQAENKIPLSAFAVDMIYKDTKRFLESNVISKWDFQTLSESFSAYPGHFTGAYFQKLSLKDENGKERLFDEIISSNSLGYLLARYHGLSEPEYKKVRAHDKAMLKSVIGHLKKGGVLRIWPIYISPIVPYTRHQYLQTLLDELIDEKVISNHNFDFSQEPTDPKGDWAPEYLLMLQR